MSTFESGEMSFVNGPEVDVSNLLTISWQQLMVLDCGEVRFSGRICVIINMFATRVICM